MPLSPFFANLILKDFDKNIEANEYKMIRYADDLIIFTDSHSECLEIHEFCKNLLNTLELRIPEPGHDSKTKIYRPDETAEFLGVGLVRAGETYALNILPAQIEKIKQRIFDLTDFNKLLKQKITISRLGQRLEATISGYAAAYDYCSNNNYLEHILESTKTKAFERIYSDGLGINTSNLSNAQRHFLGI